MNYTELLIGLRKILRYINLENKKIEKKYGVSTPQILILNYLFESDNYQSTSTHLKKYLNLNASTITGIISRLEAKRYISKIPDTKDKRITKISLTIEGINFIKNFPPVLHEKFAKKLEQLDKKELQAIKKSIDSLALLLEADDFDASPVLTFQENLHHKVQKFD